MHREVIDKYYLLLHPRPAYIIGSGKWGEKINFMAASWVTPVAEEPPRVAIAIDIESYTHELIKEFKEFTVNILPLSKVNIVYKVGSISGRRKNKSDLVRARKGEKVDAPVIEDSLGHLECRVVDEHSSEDVTLFIGDILSAKVNTEYFSEKSGWNFKKINIPLHNWGRGFYSVGRFILVR